MLRSFLVLIILFFLNFAQGQTCQEIFVKPVGWHQNRWTTDKIIDVILALKAAGLPLYGKAVKNGGIEYKAVVEATLGYPGSLKRLVESKPEPGWTWNLALERAGLDPVVERAFKAPWTANEIGQLVSAFHQAGLAVNRAAVSQGGMEYQRVAKVVLGREVSLERLVNVSPEPGWTWESALRRAGLNPAEHILKKHQWTEEEIVQVIQGFHNRGLAINLHAVKQGGVEYEAVLMEVLGFSHGTQGIIYAKPTEGWTWEQAIRKAGLNPAEHVTYQHQWTSSEIVTLIQAFHEAGLPINRYAVEMGGEAYRKIILEVTGTPTGTHGMVKSQPEEGWTWDVALIRAGFHPNEVRLRGSAPFHLLTEAMREDFGARYEYFNGRGDFAIEGVGDGKVERVAVERTTPEDIVQSQQVSALVKALSLKMTEREQKIFDGMLDYIEFYKELNLPELLGFLKHRIEDIEMPEIQLIFFKIKEDPQIVDLFLNQ